MSKEYAEKILELIDKSPTAFHVVENAKAILDSQGFTGLKESDVWNLAAGGKYYVTRNDSSIIAFQIPKKDYAGFRIIASDGGRLDRRPHHRRCHPDEEENR